MGRSDLKNSDLKSNRSTKKQRAPQHFVAGLFALISLATNSLPRLNRYLTYSTLKAGFDLEQAWWQSKGQFFKEFSMELKLFTPRRFVD